MSQKYAEQLLKESRSNSTTFVPKRKTFMQNVLTNRYLPFICLFCLCCFIAIGTPMIWSRIWRPSVDPSIESDLRFDCSPLHPRPKINIDDCNRKYCVWDNFTTLPEEIACYYRMERDDDISGHMNLMPRYRVASNFDKYQATLEIINKAPFIRDIRNDDLSKAPVVYDRLTITIKHYTEKHFSILIKPEHEAEDLWSKHYNYNYQQMNHFVKSEADITVSGNIEKDYFQLKIERLSNKKYIFNMGSHSPFIFANGLIEITTLLNNDLIYGLGQSNQPFRFNFSSVKQWDLFNQYHLDLNENSTRLFGTHPFYMGVDDEENHQMFGVLLLNTFPIHVNINGRPSLTLRTTGGHLEFHFFMGPSPAEVMQQFQTFIYKPAMPPYWALGFHMCHSQCSLPSFYETVHSFHSKRIPVESDCGTAIPHTKQDLSSFARQLHNANMKWISVITPHLINEPKESDFILKNQKSKPYSGIISTCGHSKELVETHVYYPDFFNEKIDEQYELYQLNSNADAFILDQNTPIDNKTNESCLAMLERYKWNYYYFAELNAKNPCMDSLLSDPSVLDKMDGSSIVGPYLAVHNLYGFKHSQTIFRRLQKEKPDRRPFLMSLSTYVGSGRYGGHISIPINSTWEMLRFSFKQMLDFSLFGVSMTGFPVGGYKGSPQRNDNLMRKWYQLASMQPFMIAFSGLGQIDTPSIKSLENAIRNSVKTRYRILPYLYTLFYNASINGSLVAQPLFFQFDQDKLAYKVEEQYMLGPSLMVSPIMYKDKASIPVYFPAGRWYDFYSGHIIWNSDSGTAELSTVNLNIHLRGGQMMAIQDPEMTITETRRKKGFDLIGGYDGNKQCSGELYLDNGDDPWPVTRYLRVYFQAYYNNITIVTHQFGDYCRLMEYGQIFKHNTNIETIKLFGIINPPEHDHVEIYEEDMDSLNGRKPGPQAESVQYDAKFGVLKITVKLDLCKILNHRTNVPYLKHIWFLQWTVRNW